MATTETQRESMSALLSFSYISVIHSFLLKVRQFTGSGGTCLKALRKQRQKDYKSEAPQNTQGDCLNTNWSWEDRSHIIKVTGHGGVHMQCQHWRAAARLSGQQAWPS